MTCAFFFAFAYPRLSATYSHMATAAALKLAVTFVFLLVTTAAAAAVKKWKFHLSLSPFARIWKLQTQHVVVESKSCSIWLADYDDDADDDAGDFRSNLPLKNSPFEPNLLRFHGDGDGVAYSLETMPLGTSTKPKRQPCKQRAGTDCIQSISVT